MIVHRARYGPFGVYIFNHLQAREMKVVKKVWEAWHLAMDSPRKMKGVRYYPLLFRREIDRLLQQSRTEAVVRIEAGKLVVSVGPSPRSVGRVGEDVELPTLLPSAMRLPVRPVRVDQFLGGNTSRHK